MKVSVEKQELQRKLSDIQNIVEKRNTMPILNHFLLVAEGQHPYVTATDLETAFKEPIALTVKEEGRMCIPAKKLLEIVREVEDDVILESVDNQWLKVKSGKTHFRLACLSADEFPVWPPLHDTEELTVPSAMFLEMIEKTIYAAGESDTRYVLNGLLFHVKPEGILTIVGTDGHRLALCEKSLGAPRGEEKRMILSRKAVTELRRFLSEEDTPVKIAIGKNHVLFEMGDVQFLTRLIEGTYPNYEQVIPADNQKTVTADRESLMRSLRRVSIMSKERSSAVKVEINAGQMVISASNPDLGEATDEIGITYSGEEMAIGFNARYVLDALSVMDGEKVLLRLKEPLSATLIQQDGREDHKCVVMPMRL